MKKSKRLLSLLLALVMMFSLVESSVVTAWADSNQVRVIVENTTFSVADGAPWDGTLVNEWVDIDDDSTMMSCVVSVLDKYSYYYTGAESNYISEINGLAQKACGDESGWMGTLNDWFTNEGFDGFTVANDKLEAGDEIRIMYSCNGSGADLGGSWGNNDKTVKALTFGTGTLEPAFSKDTHAYTLTVPAGTTGVVVTPTASNKNFQVRTSVDGTEYKRTATVPVAEGTEITVKCGDPSWPSMNNQEGGTGASVEAQVYTITVKMGTEGGGTPEPTPEPETPVSVNVTLRSQAEGGYLHGVTTVAVSADTAEKYGYTDKVTDGVSALDALVAAHEVVFEEAFTTETASTMLAVNEGGWVTTIFGTETNSSGFAVNQGYPSGETWDSSVKAIRLNEGDVVDFFLYGDTTGWSDYYTFIDAPASMEAGLYTTVTVTGIKYGWEGYEYATPETMKAAATPLAGVQLAWLEPSTGETTDITGAVTDADGKATFKVPSAATGYLVAKSGDSVYAIMNPTDKLEITATKGFTGSGTQSDPYLLNDADDLQRLSSTVAEGETYAGKYFRITNNITLPNNWTPIGSLKEGQTWSSTLKSVGYNLFSGSIDGAKNDGSGQCWTITVPRGSQTMLGALKNSTISNLNIYGEQIEGYGVVDYYHNGAGGIVIDNVTLKSGSHTKYSGFIGGYASGSNSVVIRNSTVEAGVVIGDDGTIPGWAEDMQKTFSYPYGPDFTPQFNDMIGSFAGAFNGTIENCVSHATVYGRTCVGGIMGFKGQSMGDCIVRNCVFDGQVIATGEYVGGIMGSGYAATSAPNAPCVTIENCAVTGSVTGGNNVGGILGGNKHMKQCKNNGIGYIRGNYFNGTLTATAADAVVGGIIGYIKGIDIYNVINNNYYLNTAAARGIGSIGSVETTHAQYGRTDDPTGADAEKLAAPFAASELSTLASKLNASGAGKAWNDNLTLNTARRVVRMKCSTLNSMSPTTFKQSAGLMVLDTHSITVTYSDGSTETIKAIQCKVGNLDLSTAGYQLATLTYKNYTLCFGVKVNTDGAASDETTANVAISKINGIGDVTVDSKEAIEDAREAYDALTDDQKALVPDETLKALTDAEAALAKATADKAAADAVAGKINGIGTVTRRSGAAIKAARDAYDALTDDQKALISDETLKVLTDAEATYAALTAHKPGKPGTTGKNDTTDKKVQSAGTGDNSNMTLWLGGVVLSAAALVLLNRKRRSQA